MVKVKGRERIENVHCGSGSRILGGLFREFGMTRAAHVALVGHGRCQVFQGTREAYAALVVEVMAKCKVEGTMPYVLKE